MGTYFDVAYMIKSFPTLLGMVHITLLVTIVSAILGILLGAVIAILRIQRVPVVAPLLRVFISFMRGTPFLVQLFLAYFGVPEILAHVGISMKGVPRADRVRKSSNTSSSRTSSWMPQSEKCSRATPACS